MKLYGETPSGEAKEGAIDKVVAGDGDATDHFEVIGVSGLVDLTVVLVEAKTALRIPVSCVEQGRWSRVSPSFLPGSHVSHAQLRRRKLEAQAARPHARGAAQSEVWDAVHGKAARMSVDSPTGASSDLYRHYQRDVRALEDAFPAQPGQCGAVLGLGADLCLDVVSRPDAFARVWPKLRAGYLLDALERLNGKPTSSSVVQSFVRTVGQAEATPQPSVGLGLDMRLSSVDVIGSGLELDGEVVQLSAFRSEDAGRRAFGRIARPSRRR